MASAGSGLVAVQQGVFEPLFPRAAMPALPRPSALPPLPGDDPVAQSAARERAAREEGRAAGFREGVAQGAHMLGTHAGDLEQGFVRGREDACQRAQGGEQGLPHRRT